MGGTSDKSFVDVVKRRIKMLGRSQKSLAVALGVSPAYVSQVISRKKRPPDLSSQRNRRALEIWCDFLEMEEAELIDLVRHEIHMTPLPPAARYPRFRSMALSSLNPERETLIKQIRGMALHPAEHALISILTQIYSIEDRVVSEKKALVFNDLVNSLQIATSNPSFIESELCDRFEDIDFVWDRNKETGQINITTESSQINKALGFLRSFSSGDLSLKYNPTVPLVGLVTATDGFVYDEADFLNRVASGKTQLPLGINPWLSPFLYSVQVFGDSLRMFFSDGTLLFVKFGSWKDVVDGDVVIFRDRLQNRAFLKKIELFDNILLLKSLNPVYRDMVVSRSELTHVERVVAVVF